MVGAQVSSQGEDDASSRGMPDLLADDIIHLLPKVIVVKTKLFFLVLYLGHLDGLGLRLEFSDMDVLGVSCGVRS